MSLRPDSIGMRVLDAIGLTLGALLIVGLLFVPDILDQARDTPELRPEAPVVIEKVVCT